MAVHRFLVEVKTKDEDVDAPSADAIRNEIQNNLEWDSHRTGIEGVVVQTIHQQIDLGHG